MQYEISDELRRIILTLLTNGKFNQTFQEIGSVIQEINNLKKIEKEIQKDK
jgi:hypothetical protein